MYLGVNRIRTQGPTELVEPDDLNYLVPLENELYNILFLTYINTPTTNSNKAIISTFSLILLNLSPSTKTITENSD